MDANDHEVHASAKDDDASTHTTGSEADQPATGRPSTPWYKRDWTVALWALVVFAIIGSLWLNR